MVAALMVRCVRPVLTSKPFPFPYYDDFEGYQSAKAWSYLPHYTTDFTGVFELTAFRGHDDHGPGG